MIDKSGEFFIPSPALADAMKAYSRAFIDIVPIQEIPDSKRDEIIPFIHSAIKSGKKLTSEDVASALKLNTGA